MLMLTVSRSLLLDLVLCTRVGSASRARSPPMELSRPRESSSRDPPRNEGSKMAIAGTPAALRTDAVPPPLTSTVLTSKNTPPPPKTQRSDEARRRFVFWNQDHRSRAHSRCRRSLLAA